MSLIVDWVIQQPTFNTPDYNSNPRMVMDSEGSIYVVYQTNGTVSGQTNMGGYDVAVLKLNRNGVVQWVIQQPTFNTTYNDSIPDIAVDAMDNIYITYQTNGTVSGQSHTGLGTDIVVVKLEPTVGDIIWVSQRPTFNTTLDDLNPSITTDSNGYIYVGYYTRGGTASGQTTTGAFDIVVFKLESVQGHCLWVAQQPTFNGALLNSLVKIVAGHHGGLYGAYQIIGQVGSQIYTGGLADIMVFKLETQYGHCLWVSQQPSFNTNGYDHDASLALDQNDQIYVTYSTDRTASGQVYTGGDQDIVVFKLEPDAGLCQWVKQVPSFNTTGDDLRPSMTISLSGYIYIGYATTGIVSGQVYTGGDHDIVIFKLEPTQGLCVWNSQLPTFNTPDDDLNPFIMIDEADDLYLTYQTTGTPTSEGQTLTGMTDVIIFKLTPPSPQIEMYEFYGVLDLPYAQTSPIVGTYIIYTYGVINTGSLPITNLLINDNRGTTNLSINNLLPGQSTVINSRQYQLVQHDLDVGAVQAQASVDGRYYDTTTTSYRECTVNIQQIIQLSFYKNTLSADTYIGGYVVYELIVKNTGNVGFHGLILSDPKIGFEYHRSQLKIQETWTEIVSLLITPEIYNEYKTQGDVTNIGTVFGLDSDNNPHTYQVSNHTQLCLLGQTLIQMMDGSLKPIKTIQRGDQVSTGHTVARLCMIKIDPHLITELMMFSQGCLDGTRPIENLGITGNHPIIDSQGRHPAKCFDQVAGVTQIRLSSLDFLYDLQFDHDGTYLANGVEVQSCSPNSAYNPLPRHLYYNASLYTDELVWDTYSQDLTLITERVILPPKI